MKDNNQNLSTGSTRKGPIYIRNINDFTQNVKFVDPVLQSMISSLCSTIRRALKSGEATPLDIAKFLMGAGLEIAIQYNSNEAHEDYMVGDIVDCKFGTHVDGEISGGHVHSIVCDIDDDGMVYVLPITKLQLENDVNKYLPFTAGIDVIYRDPNKYQNGGTVLLKMGKYVRPERINELVATTTLEFFYKVLGSLSTIYQFTVDSM